MPRTATAHETLRDRARAMAQMRAIWHCEIFDTTHGGHEDHPPGPAVMRNGQSTANRLAYTGQSALAIATVNSKGTTAGVVSNISQCQIALICGTASYLALRPIWHDTGSLIP